MPRDQERMLLDETTRTIAQHEGRAPTSWLGPWISQSRQSPDLLRETGHRYCLDWCCHDQPIWFQTRAGRLLAVPYPQEINDIPAIAVRRASAIVGQPFGLRQLRRALAHIGQQRDVIWLTRPGDVAAHSESLPPGTVPGG